MRHFSNVKLLIHYLQCNVPDQKKNELNICLASNQRKIITTMALIALIRIIKALPGCCFFQDASLIAFIRIIKGKYSFSNLATMMETRKLPIVLRLTSRNRGGLSLCVEAKAFALLVQTLVVMICTKSLFTSVLWVL